MIHLNFGIVLFICDAKMPVDTKGKIYKTVVRRVLGRPQRPHMAEIKMFCRAGTNNVRNEYVAGSFQVAPVREPIRVIRPYKQTRGKLLCESKTPWQMKNSIYMVDQRREKPDNLEDLTNDKRLWRRRCNVGRRAVGPQRK